MILIEQYKIYKRGTEYVVVGEETELFCPFCHGVLKYRDSRIRKIILADGSHKEVRVRRLRCTCCHRVHKELPDFIQPYKRYVREVIQAVLDHVSFSVAAENSTIARWLSWFRKWKEKPFVQRLKEEYPSNWLLYANQILYTVCV